MKTIKITSFNDFLPLFDTNLTKEQIEKMILVYAEAVKKAPIFFNAKDKAELKELFKTYLNDKYKGIFYPDPLADR